MATTVQSALQSPSSTLPAQLNLQGISLPVSSVVVRVKQCPAGYYYDGNRTECNVCTTCTLYNSTCGPLNDAVCNEVSLKAATKFEYIQNKTNRTLVVTALTSEIPLTLVVPIVLGVLLGFTGTISFYSWWRLTAGASRRLLESPMGTIANKRDLPRELRKDYFPDKLMGKGVSGIVIKVKEMKRRKVFGEFAIKLIHSPGRKFTEKETRKLEREV